MSTDLENNVPNNMSLLEPTVMEPLPSAPLPDNASETINSLPTAETTPLDKAEVISAADQISVVSESEGISATDSPDTSETEGKEASHQYIPYLSDMSTVVAPTYGEEKKRSPLPFILIGVGVIVLGLIIFFSIRFFKGKTLSDKERVFLATAKTLGDQSIFAVMGDCEDEAGNGMLLPGYMEDFRLAKTTIDSIKDQGANTQVVLKLKNLAFDDMSTGSILNTISGVALTANGQYAPKMGQIYEELKLTYAGFKLFSTEIALNDTSVSVAVPDKFNGYLTVDLLHFGRKYNDADEIINGGNLLPDAFAEALSVSPIQVANFPDLTIHAFITSESAAASLLTFYDSIEVTKDETKKDVTVGGEPLRCEVFHMNIAKEDLQAFGNSYREWYLATLENYLKNNKGIAAVLLLNINPSNTSSTDVVGDLMAYLEENLSEDKMSEFFSAFEDNLSATMLIDKDNRLISCTTETTITTDDETFDLSAEIHFNGNEYLCDDITASLILAGEFTTYSIDYSNKGSTTNNIRNDQSSLSIKEDGQEKLRFDLTAEYDLSSRHFHDELTCQVENSYDDYSVSLITDGSTSIESDKCTLNVDTLTMSYSSDSTTDFTVEFGLNAEISKLEDSLTQLRGTELRLFDMTQEDFDNYNIDPDDILYDLFNGIIW